jgi:hypothetical protein
MIEEIKELFQSFIPPAIKGVRGDIRALDAKIGAFRQIHVFWWESRETNEKPEFRVCPEFCVSADSGLTIQPRYQAANRLFKNRHRSMHAQATVGSWRSGVQL